MTTRNGQELEAKEGVRQIQQQLREQQKRRKVGTGSRVTLMHSSGDEDPSESPEETVGGLDDPFGVGQMAEGQRSSEEESEPAGSGSGPQDEEEVEEGITSGQDASDQE